ncbi:hypothetical protein SAICODRAFT_34804 [Saitoella complicata NRRL Y-17804]|uniref:uncharacterized protein n=1 Tax=Saitoella complicata (strain BCRC 22490 / CBS 7301 / JCM 7358 / NBRC 10748 / NRRL Y-17804) TaxID=698492 RepID=UPI000867F8E2|nr:uncharacterized protein SAICODRAFT_34804 [Saitoella complicata NRRL Y-17804]ODQ53309.1 hypothetical protein SAICODRAFT_34804 [Saitoella complicata NRRL Y-17804]
MGEYKWNSPRAIFIYDTVLWCLSVLVDLFFRQVQTRGSFKVPRRGPIIFVAAPHANQFVDPLLLMRQVRLEASRRVNFLVAAKSMQRKFIGAVSRAVGGIPVGRAQDLAKPATGTIRMPNLSQPNMFEGIGTKFTEELKPGYTFFLPQDGGSAEVVSIESDTECTLKRDFKDEKGLQLLAKKEGTKYKVAPKVDQTEVYNAVFDRLNEGGCVGIFPEGGSHDRSDLLPLKAGVAIMALGAIAKNPGCDVKIIPCGMNYFHAHKFRSRAVIEFGSPLSVDPELVEMYKTGDKREAVKKLLDQIYNALQAVTVLSPDYDTLMVVQAARRLYKPSHKKLPLAKVVDLNRRFIAGYTHFKDDPRVQHLRKGVLDYNRQLSLLGIRDHQVQNARYHFLVVLCMMIYRIIKLIVLTVGALPGFVLFAPVFIATKVISKKKAKEALEASTVKIQGRDVLATWKLLVSLGLAPILYTWYSFLATYITYKYDLLPAFLSRFIWLVPVISMFVLPNVSYASLRFGESGMDIFKSLRPLFLLLLPGSANTVNRLRERREALAFELTELINTLGPEIFPDFNANRIVSTPDLDYRSSEFRARSRSRSRSRSGDESPSSTPGSPVTRNASFANLGDVPLFPTIPRPRSRSRGLSGGLGKMSQIITTSDDKGIGEQNGETIADIAKKIRGAFSERRRKKAESRGSEWSGVTSGAETPADEAKKTI